MCGIAMVMRKDGKAAAKSTLKRYRKQRNRGSDGFGYLAIATDGTLKHKRFQHEHDMIAALEVQQEGLIVFHHRYPTSVLNIRETAHPIRVSHPGLKHDYYVLHNGWITNADELKKKHEGLGYKYDTEVETWYTPKGSRERYEGAAEFNDSEALAIELAQTIDGLQDSAKAEGPIAHITAQVDKRTKRVIALHFGTNGGNPLTLSEHDHMLTLTSEGGRAILANHPYQFVLATNEIIDGPAKLQAYEYASKKSATSYYNGAYNYTPNDWMPTEHIGELDEIDERIIDLQAEAEYLASQGNADGAEDAQQEARTLMQERDKLEAKYANQP